MRSYMDYLLFDNGISINALDAAGNVVAEGIDELTLVYQRDRNGNALFLKEGKYYYIIEGTGTLAQVNYDPVFGSTLSYSYSKADVESPVKLYRFYIDKEEIRLFSTKDGKDVTDFVHRVVEFKGEDQFEKEMVPPYKKRVCDVRLWGYMDAAGREVIGAQYYSATEFNADGYAFVSAQDGHVMMIDKNGSVILDPYGRIVHLEMNETNAALDGFYMPDNTGEKAIGMFRFDHGLMRVVRKYYDYYALDTLISTEDALVYENGQLFAIPSGYRLCAYSDGVLLLERNGLYGYMDYTGRWITDPVFTYARPFFEGLAVVGSSSGSCCMIDTNGNIVMPMSFEYITDCVNGAFAGFSVDKLRENYLREAVAEYEKRMSAYCRLKTIELSNEEGILSVLPVRAYKIALCIEGKQLSSEELASTIETVQVRGYSHIAVIIGGTDGMSEKIKTKCALKLSFSKMTFPHPLMRVILLEQLYRALNITAGGNYHH